jgi:hypothetical protein
MERMTSEQFVAQQEEILTGLPAEFRTFLRSQAWDRGHSAGFEEVINILKSLTADFREAFEKYQMNLSQMGR